MMRYRNFMVRAFRTGRNIAEIKAIYKELANRWINSFKPGTIPAITEQDVEDTFNHVAKLMEQ